MGFPEVAVYDACVLYPFSLRNVLVQCAVDRLVSPRWTDEIHDEWIRNLVAATHEGARETLHARLIAVRDKMKQILPDAHVGAYSDLIPCLSLPDPDDRHVLAAAIRGNATTIVTADRHFSTALLAKHGIRVEHPEGFLRKLLERDRELMLASLARARGNLRKSTPDPAAFVAMLRRTGKLDGFCDALMPHLDGI